MLSAFLLLCKSFDPAQCNINITAKTSDMGSEVYTVEVDYNESVCIDFSLESLQHTAVFVEGARESNWSYGYSWGGLTTVQITKYSNNEVGRTFRGNTHDTGYFVFNSLDSNKYNVTFFVATKILTSTTDNKGKMIISNIPKDVISIGKYTAEYHEQDLYLSSNAKAYIFYLRSGYFIAELYQKKYSYDITKLRNNKTKTSISSSHYSFTGLSNFSVEVNFEESYSHYFTLRVNSSGYHPNPSKGIHIVTLLNKVETIKNNSVAANIYPVDDTSSGGDSGDSGVKPTDYVINGLVVAIGVYCCIIFVLLIANFIVACTYPNRLYRMGVTWYCCYCCCTDSYYHSQSYYAVHPYHSTCTCCCDCGRVDCGDNDGAVIVLLILILIILIFIAFILMYTLFQMLRSAEEEERRWEQTEIRHKQPETVIITQQLVTVPTNSAAPPVAPVQAQYAPPGYAPPAYAYQQPYVPQPAYAPPPQANPYAPPVAPPPAGPYVPPVQAVNPYEDMK